MIHKLMFSPLVDMYDGDDELFLKSMSIKEERTKMLKHIRNLVEEVTFGETEKNNTKIPLKYSIPEDEHAALTGLYYFRAGFLPIIEGARNAPPVLKCFIWGSQDFVFPKECGREIAYEFTEGKYSLKKFKDKKLLAEIRKEMPSIQETIDDIQKYFCVEIENESHQPHVSSAEFISSKIVEFIKCVDIIESKSDTFYSKL